MKKSILLFWIGFSFWSCQHEQMTVVRMETSLGNIRFQLYKETSEHRENMIKLVKEGYYNGMLFHRVIQNFMIQTGDPLSKTARSGMLLGAGDIGYTIKAEILPQYFHKRGVIAAARESDNINPGRHSSGSHFYIVQGKIFSPDSLDMAVEKINDKRYTAFFHHLKARREAEIMKYQLAEDYDNLMRVNRELSEEIRAGFDQKKLVLSEEQKKAYTTVGGTPHLDGEYTVFGEVMEGMEVVDKIAAIKTDSNCRPETDVVVLKMTIE